NEPVLANFSSDTTEGEMPFTVDFCNFSIGDIQQYKWDFDNDGNVDSYEQSPVYTFQDTGYYSVKLTVTGPDSSNTFLKENYIHVQKITGFGEIYPTEISCYPNPFHNSITFEFSNYQKPDNINIYDIKGKLMNVINKPKGTNKAIWDGKDNNGFKCKPGIYYLSGSVDGIQIYSKKLLKQ
ncbi:MAG: hypothetical protein DRJ05_17105, partial [Bacteroidetes bacterium]